MHLSLDTLNTRNKEDRFLQTCFDVQQRFVIDNTNPAAKDREKYIKLVKAYHYKLVGYFFQCTYDEAWRRNALRSGKELIAEAGLRSTLKKLEPLRYREGFDELFTVCLATEGFVIKRLPYEV